MAVAREMPSDQVFGSLSQRVALLAVTTRNVTPDKGLPPSQVLGFHAGRLDKLALLLKEMQREVELGNVEVSGLDLSAMEAELMAEEELMEFYASRRSLYLVMACPYLIKHLRNSAFILSQAMGVIGQNGCPPDLKQELSQLQKIFEEEAPKLGAKEQQIVDYLETGVLDTVVHHDSQSAKLAEQIAECVGLSLDSEAFKDELAKFQEEKGTAEQREGKVHAMILDQYINLLERAVAEKTSPSTPVRHGPPSKLMTMKETPFLPLQSFICPITKDVMRDPVQIASGQTYERAAIERWFAAGHNRCPLGVELKNTKMKSNFALRQSIAEWRERNWNIRMHIAEAGLSSEDLEGKLKALVDLQALCEEDSLNRYSISNKGLIPPLVHLAESKNMELRIKTLSTLRSLAQDNDENQELMVREGVIDLIVRCLARQSDEAKQAILLLRVLSAKPVFAELISHSQGAVLLLVTLLGSEEGDLIDDVKSILENLPPSDENIINMAKANLLTPLISRLIDGKTGSKILMARTLARLHIPDTSKQNLATGEAISTLIKMMASGNTEESESAISALGSLSSVAVVANLVVDGGALHILKSKLLFPRSTVETKTGVAHIVKNILVAWGSNLQDNEDSEAELDGMIYTCLSLLKPLTPAAVQHHLLMGLLGLARGKRSRKIARTKMVDQQAFSMLMPLVKAEAASDVRSSAMQLFASLSRSFSSKAGAAVSEDKASIPSFVDAMLRNLGCNGEEQLSAARILANLSPTDSGITSALVQANIVQVLVKLLGSSNSALEEAVSGALLRFTVPGDIEMQRKLAILGVIPKLVSLLDSGKSMAKARAGRALANFSSNSHALSEAVASPKWWACFAPVQETCRLHGGICTVEGSFCLLEADAITPLLSVLKEQDPDACEAALAALDTLANKDNKNWEQGIHLIAKAKGGVPSVVKVLSSGTPAAQELALKLVEKVFSIPEYKDQYGAAAQMHIITVAQQGPSDLKHLAGKILRQLDLLHSQSHYFAPSTG